MTRVWARSQASDGWQTPACLPPARRVRLCRGEDLQCSKVTAVVAALEELPVEAVLLEPAAWSRERLVGESGESKRLVLGRLPQLPVWLVEHLQRLLVRQEGGVNRVGQVVDHDRDEHFVVGDVRVRRSGVGRLVECRAPGVGPGMVLFHNPCEDADRVVVEAISDRGRLGTLDLDVAIALFEIFERALDTEQLVWVVAEQFERSGGETRVDSLVDRKRGDGPERQLWGRKVDVRDLAVGTVGEEARDDRAPVAALRHVRFEAEHRGHESIKDACRVLQRPSFLERALGEAKTGQAGHDDLEARRARLDELRGKVEGLGETTGPAVREDERNRRRVCVLIGAGRFEVLIVDLEAFNLHLVVWKAVELGLDIAPPRFDALVGRADGLAMVVFRIAALPVGEHLTELGELCAIFPRLEAARDVGLTSTPSPAAAAQRRIGSADCLFRSVESSGSGSTSSSSRGVRGSGRQAEPLSPATSCAAGSLR
ncbi:hypothetical protein L1887_59810 [Cichorium endivia]|nr:hypothetical protein L1887_59810 [Cichorium endivia]